MGMSPSSACVQEGSARISASTAAMTQSVCTAGILSTASTPSQGDTPVTRARLAFPHGPVRFSLEPVEVCMKEVRKVHYVKGVFVCPKCRQSYVQEKWIESWRVRCHRCDYRGALTDVSVEERMEEETFRR